jgi:hypothetical protein
VSPAYHLLDLAHEETRGCVFDFCELRADIDIKLQTMDICEPCRGKLAALRIDADPVVGGFRKARIDGEQGAAS